MSDAIRWNQSPCLLHHDQTFSGSILILLAFCSKQVDGLIWLTKRNHKYAIRTISNHSRDREMSLVYSVKPQFKPWLAKTYLSHSLWGRGWPRGWQKCPYYGIHFQRKGRLGEKGWKKRNNTIEGFVLTCHLDSSFVADLRAGKCFLVPEFIGI